MIRKEDPEIQALFARVCGLDVHKKEVVAYLRILYAQGVVHITVRRFGITLCGGLITHQSLTDLLAGAPLSLTETFGQL